MRKIRTVNILCGQKFGVLLLNLVVSIVTTRLWRANNTFILGLNLSGLNLQVSWHKPPLHLCKRRSQRHFDAGSAQPSNCLYCTCYWNEGTQDAVNQVHDVQPPFPQKHRVSQPYAAAPKRTHHCLNGSPGRVVPLRSTDSIRAAIKTNVPSSNEKMRTQTLEASRTADSFH